MTININFTGSNNRRPRTLSAYQHKSTHRTSQRPNGSPWLGQAREDIDKGTPGKVALDADDDPEDEVQAIADWGIKELDVVAIWKPRNSDDYICTPWPKQCYHIADMFGVPFDGIPIDGNDRVPKFTWHGCDNEEIADCPSEAPLPTSRYTAIGIDADDVSLTMTPAECPLDSVTPSGIEFSIASGRLLYDGTSDREFRITAQAVTTGTGDATIELIHTFGGGVYFRLGGADSYFRPGGVDSYERFTGSVIVISMQATGVDTTTKIAIVTLNPSETIHLEAYENAGGYSMVVEMDQTEILIEP